MKDIIIVDFGSRYVNDIASCLSKRNISYSVVKWFDAEQELNQNHFKGIFFWQSKWCL